MEKANLNFFYNKEGDILDISIGVPQPAISDEIGDDIIIRHHPEPGEIVGVTILNFEHRFEKDKQCYKLPVEAQFSMAFRGKRGTVMWGNRNLGKWGYSYSYSIHSPFPLFPSLHFIWVNSYEM